VPAGAKLPDDPDKVGIITVITARAGVYDARCNCADGGRCVAFSMQIPRASSAGRRELLRVL
jgi:hypothetical protein